MREALRVYDDRNTVASPDLRISECKESIQDSKIIACGLFLQNTYESVGMVESKQLLYKVLHGDYCEGHQECRGSASSP